jgi:WXXGXW repeat (2 copies)
MHIYRAIRAIAIAATLAGSFTACAVRAHAYSDTEYASEEPPAPRSEYVGERQGYIFIQGNWYRSGNQWAWRQGRWERQRPAASFVQGRWVNNGNRWRWADGHWREGGRYGRGRGYGR